MELTATITDFFTGSDRSVVPCLSVDCSVVGFNSAELKVLLLKWRQTDRWSPPGGYVGRDESLDAAAERILRERTG